MRRAAIQDRLHERYELPAWADVGATVNGQRYRVSTLGYGGVGLELGGGDARLPDGEVALELHVFGRSFACPAEVRFRSDKQVGLQFSYRELQALENLRQVIQWLVLGAKLAKGQAADTYLQCDDGPHDLYVQLEFRVGSVTCQLRLQDGVLETWHDLGAGGELTEMQPTQNRDATVVRCGVLIMLGMLHAQQADLLLERAGQAIVQVVAREEPTQRRKLQPVADAS